MCANFDKWAFLICANYDKWALGLLNALLIGQVPAGGEAYGYRYGA